MTQRWSVTALTVTNTVQAPWMHKYYPKIIRYMDDQEKAMAKALISRMHLCLLGDISWYIKPSNLPFKVGFQLNNICLAERAWCSAGSTGGRASQSLQTLGRLTWFSLMTCCERPACRTTGRPLILFSSKPADDIGYIFGDRPLSLRFQSRVLIALCLAPQSCSDIRVKQM